MSKKSNLTEEYKLLARVISERRIPFSALSEEEVVLGERLLRLKAVMRDGSGNLYATNESESILTSYQRQSLRDASDKRTASRRYWITTGIAILSLMISIAALLTSCELLPLKDLAQKLAGK